MIWKTYSVFVLLCFGVQINSVLTKTVLPSQIEPLPDVYSHVTTYPAANNVVSYNASPNPQYTSPNFNHFNDQMAPPTLHMPGNYQKREYHGYQPKSVQRPKSSEEMTMGMNPTTANYDYSSDLKNTLVSVNDNLGLMADTQRLLLNSFKVQQQQYNNIEQKLNDTPFQRNSAYNVNGQQNYGPAATQQPQYQYQVIVPPSPPSLPPLPYGQSTEKEHTVHHHKKHSSKTLLKKLFKKHKKGNNRGLALFQRRSQTERLQRHAAMTLSYIKNGILNALYTAAVVACVKLVPILLFGFKLMFRSVLPLTGLALLGTDRGLFPKTVKKDDEDDDLQLDDDDDDDDEDDDEDEVVDEDRDVTEEKKESGHRYR